MHSLRASPSFGNPLLLEFDSALRDCLCAVVNADLSDRQWIQASLPVRLGGLRIRLVSHLAPSAFLASAFSTRQLQDAILLHCTVSPDVSVDRALSFWSSGRNLIAPPPISAGRQRSWDTPLVQVEHRQLLASLPNALDRARLLAVSAARGSDWFHALLTVSWGLFLDNEAVRVAVSFRLG